MLSEKLYKVGKIYNLITKYNINYDRRNTLNFVCAIHINDLLQSQYGLSTLQESKLKAIANNLIVL